MEDQSGPSDTQDDDISPPSPDFHGFGDEDVPGRLVVETAGVDDEEYVISVSREKPPSAPLSPTQASSKIIPKAKSRVSGVTGTLSRSKVYLLGMVESKFKFAKLPKTKAVLSVFLSNFKETEGFEMAAAQEAAEIVLVQLKEVWRHHFGLRVIMGYDTDMEETKKIISNDKNIKKKILKVWKEWKEMERTSKREDRCQTPGFKKKEEKFVNDVVDMPFNILRRDYEAVLKNDSGIKDWKEDLAHLHNQL